LALLILGSYRPLASCNLIYTVQPDERGVELRFGKPKDEISQPGLHVILLAVSKPSSSPVLSNAK
jgi:membrane protease subunit HflK